MRASSSALTARAWPGAASAGIASGSRSRSSGGSSCGFASGRTRVHWRRPPRPGWPAVPRARRCSPRRGWAPTPRSRRLGLDEAARSHVEVAVDALSAALGDAVARGASVAPAAGRAVVAMSGGVDSALVLAETAARGDAVGLTLRLWIDPQAPDPERACCAPSAVRRARDACHAREVPHLALDLRDSFHDAIVAPFVADYAAGATPNPCVRCNGDFRFDALLDAAARLGGEQLLTGHYARIAHVEGVPVVARGIDARKDQSYMLARLEPAALQRVGFPLGESTKEETRARARALGLAAADAPESQEVCFLGGGDDTAASCVEPACRSATAPSSTSRAVGRAARRRRRVHRGPAPRCRGGGWRAAVRPAHGRAGERRRRGAAIPPRDASPATPGRADARCAPSRGREAAVPLAAGAGAAGARGRRRGAAPGTARRSASRPGRRRRSTTGTPWSAPARSSSTAPRRLMPRRGVPGESPGRLERSRPGLRAATTAVVASLWVPRRPSGRVVRSRRQGLTRAVRPVRRPCRLSETPRRRP